MVCLRSNQCGEHKEIRARLGGRWGRPRGAAGRGALAVSLALVIHIGTVVYTELYDRRWVNRPPVGLVPNATPENSVRRPKERRDTEGETKKVNLCSPRVTCSSVSMKDPRAYLDLNALHVSSERTKAVLITIDQCFPGSNGAAVVA